MKQWIENYNHADVETDAIPSACIQAAALAQTVMTSTLKRATASCLALGRHASAADAIFSEAELPHAPWSAPSLPPKVWAIVLRVLWRCGYAHGAQSHASTRTRAEAAAGKLVLAASAGPVLLVGHAIMNRYIGKELRKLGWTAVSGHGDRYWGMRVYQAST